MIFTRLNFKAQFMVFFALMLFIGVNSYAQDNTEGTKVDESLVLELEDDLTLDSDDLDSVALEMEEKAELVEDSKTKLFFRKLGKQLKKLGQKIGKVVSPNEEKRAARKAKRLARKKARKERRAKRKAERAKRIAEGRATLLQRVLYKTGKGAAWLSTTVARPFVNSAGFITGVLERSDKNQDAHRFLTFFLKNEKEFSEVYKESPTLLGFGEALASKVEDVLAKRVVTAIKDSVNILIGEEIDERVILKTIGIIDDENVPVISEEIKDKIYKADPTKFNEALANFSKPEYDDIRALTGSISKKSFAELILAPDFDAELDFNKIIDGSRMRIHEGLIGFSGQIFLPQMAVGLVSKSLAAPTLGVTLLADAGTAASALLCTKNKKIIKKLEGENKELKDFCSYVVNRSAYVLSRSRARGYVAGKNTRQKIRKVFKKKNKKERKEKSQDLNKVTIE